MNKEELKERLTYARNFSDGPDLKKYNDLEISQMKGLGILIAVKSAFMRVILTKALETLGFHVLGSATDGEEAVDRYRQLKPDIMLVDIDLDGIDGIDVVRTITSEDPDAVVIMVIEETEDMQDIIVKAVRAGAKSYIRKPLSEAEIIQRINGASKMCQATFS